MSFIRYIIILVSISFAACGSGDLPLDEVDPDAAPQIPTFDQVNSIFKRSCVPCHTGDNTDSNNTNQMPLLPGNGDDDGEDDDNFLPYDTCEQILNDIGNILTEAVTDESMPPGAWPRLTEREKLIIIRWLETGACAPCNPCN